MEQNRDRGDERAEEYDADTDVESQRPFRNEMPDSERHSLPCVRTVSGALIHLKRRIETQPACTGYIAKHASFCVRRLAQEACAMARIEDRSWG
jgi:hypothetical protein